MSMTALTVEGFRCFGEPQQARLAPLTLLVGGNSTGKTSFLAMVRALRQAASVGPLPHFNDPPYAFGTYDDMAHRTSPGAAPRGSFHGGLTLHSPGDGDPITFSASFAKRGREPELVRRRYESLGHWFEHASQPAAVRLGIGTPDMVFKAQWGLPRQFPLAAIPARVVMELFKQSVMNSAGGDDLHVERGSLRRLRAQWERIQEFFFDRILPLVDQEALPETRAGAPVRSRPKRTYDAAPGRQIAEGDSVPRRLADLSSRTEGAWTKLEPGLARFGAVSGLFDRIGVRRLGNNDSDPFQIQVREPDGTRKGAWRNLTDVGYGVSQALPILVEVMNGGSSQVFLLQQPEVHLHPQAQAALGSLFLSVAAAGRQLLVETHSDHLVERVRMDIRDRKTELQADEVSILYFERIGPAVRIHSLGLDAEGNVLDAPDSYRRFFLEETERAFGL